MFTKIALVALSALTLVAAQTTTNITINPSEVDVTTRAKWCQAEIGTCLTLCDNVEPKTNDCDADDLTYACTCTDGTVPPLADYVSTIPTFVCNQAYSDCINQNVGNKIGQDNCTSTIQEQCGTKDPAPVSTGSSSSSSASASGTASATAGSASSSATATSASSQAAAPTNFANVANGAAVAAIGVFAALL